MRCPYMEMTIYRRALFIYINADVRAARYHCDNASYLCLVPSLPHFS
jgi:hypothetical protein